METDPDLEAILEEALLCRKPKVVVLPVVRTMTETELAYIAGLLDGEGCFELGKTPDNGRFHYNARIKITSTSPEVMAWLTMTVPYGSVSEQRDKSPKYERVFMWGISKKEILREFLPLVIPYLVIKKIHAQLILRYCTVFPGYVRHLPTEQMELKEAYWATLSTLNSRGAGSYEKKKELMAQITELSESAS